MCHTALSYYLRATMCFAHFQTLKIMKYSFAIFHQIHRLLYANGENFIFFRRGLVFFLLNNFSDKIGKPFVGAGGAPYKCFFHI